MRMLELRFASQCEPMYRLSLLVPIDGGSPSALAGSGGRLFKLDGGGDGLPWL
jgi:hypothetical protein